MEAPLQFCQDVTDMPNASLPASRHVRLLQCYIAASDRLEHSLSQAEYHGFGVTVPINTLQDASSRSLRDAINMVIGDWTFQVRLLT